MMWIGIIKFPDVNSNNEFNKLHCNIRPNKLMYLLFILKNSVNKNIILHVKII